MAPRQPIQIDRDVLPQEVVDAVHESLGYKRAIISFSSPKVEKQTTTEARLPRDVRDACREALVGKSSKTVYFRGSYGQKEHPRVRQDIAKELSALGHSAQAIADAMGVHRVSVARWVQSNRPQGYRGHYDPIGDDEAIELGMAVLGRRTGKSNKDEIVAVLGLKTLKQLISRAEAAGFAAMDLAGVKNNK